ALGAFEPTVVVQRANRILVQVPTAQDRQALVRLIGRTGRLEFKLVEVDSVRCNAPRRPGIQYLPSDEARGVGQCVGVQSRAMVSGEHIADATRTYNESGEVAVQVRFNVQGSQRIAEVT